MLARLFFALLMLVSWAAAGVAFGAGHSVAAAVLLLHGTVAAGISEVCHRLQRIEADAVESREERARARARADADRQRAEAAGPQWIR